MEFDDALEEAHEPLHDVQELLTGHGRRRKADEINRVTRSEGVADLAFGLEAADARPLAGSWIGHHHGPFPRIDDNPWRRRDARKRVVHGPGERSTVHQHLMTEAQHRRQRLRSDLDFLVAALAQQIEEENAALKRIDRIFRQSRQDVPWRCRAPARNGLRSLANRDRPCRRFGHRVCRHLHGFFPV